MSKEGNPGANEVPEEPWLKEIGRFFGDHWVAITAATVTVTVAGAGAYYLVHRLNQKHPDINDPKDLEILAEQAIHLGNLPN